MTTHEPGAPGPPHVLITGATGYIGGRLAPVLGSAGVRLRCLTRQPTALASRVSPATEIVAGDLLDPASLDRALAGIDVAYYLVHSMGAHGDYRETDRIAARNFGEAERGASLPTSPRHFARARVAAVVSGSAASQRATRRSASISRAGSRPDRCCAKAEFPSWNFARPS